MKRGTFFAQGHRGPAPQKPPVYCGIDLGTTNSTVSVIRDIKRTDDAVEIMNKLKTMPIYQYDESFRYYRESEILPSAIWIDPDNKRVFTGLFAKKKYADGDRPLQTLRSIKTRLGGESVAEIPYTDSNRVDRFNMAECSALLLKTIRECLAEQFNHPVDDAVITVPAAFSSDERLDTLDAAGLAGFCRVRILDEPTAALLYYINGGEGDLTESELTPEGRYKLIYDIGGGTLDVSIAKISEDEDQYGDVNVKIDIAARSPRMDFGGDHFDQYLAALFLADFESANPSIENRSQADQSRIIARIVSQAEKYKIDFNQAVYRHLDDPKRLNKIKHFVQFEVIDDMSVQDILLTREIVDRLYYPLSSRPAPHKYTLLKPVTDCLQYAGLDKEDIAEVIITGGMSNFYIVEETLRKYFGARTPLTRIDPVRSVSKGAAIHHYNSFEGNEELKKLHLEDQMSDDIFIKVGGKFEKLIDRTRKPGDRGTFNLTVPDDRLAQIGIFLYYGNSDKPENFTPLPGKFIPLDRRYRKGETIELKWLITPDKTIHISALAQELSTRVDDLEMDREISRNIINRYRVNPR